MKERTKGITGISAIEVVLQLRGIRGDVRGVVRTNGLGGAELSGKELEYVIKRMGVRVRRKRVRMEEIEGRYPLPAICRKRAGGYSVLLGVKRGAGKVLELDIESGEVRSRGIDEYEEEMDGGVYIVGASRRGEEMLFGMGWFMREIGRYWGIMSEVLLGSFVVQMFGLVTPLFTQVIIDKVLVHHTISTLRVMVAGYVLIVIMEGILNVVRNYIYVHTASKIDAKLGGRIFRHLLRLYYVYFERRAVGNIIMRVRELDRIREFITERSVTLIIDTVFSMVFVVVMVIYSVKLTIISMVFMVILGIMYVILTPEIRGRLESRYRMSSRQNSYLVETVTGIGTVKGLGIEGAMTRRWDEKLGEYIESGFRLSMLVKTAGVLGQIVQKLMTIGMLYVGVMEVIGGRLTIGQLIAFQMIAGQFAGPMMRLLGLWSEVQQVMLSVERIGEIMNSPEESKGEGIRLDRIEGDIRIEGLRFRYTAEGPEVIRGIDLRIERGMRVGIVGRSGSGKSTIAKLLQRLYNATGGSIYIDGVDIREMDPEWLRGEIGVVMQESYLFSGSIRENIGIGVVGVGMDRIIDAARKSGADEFIRELPQGYETEVGERGSALSGGQKQRIAIARALIRDPRILIMDEATSSLDYESERIIRRNMGGISAGRTVLIIAHRMSTIRDCDMIVCMEGGRIVECGSHEELMGLGGYYRGMYEAQEG